jgi:hypothetical protein
MVLSAGDLAAVTAVCKVAQPSVVITAVSQPVLLCLVQQLGQDLLTDVPLKLDWLSACLPALRPLDPRVIAHSRTILVHLRLKLEEVRFFSNGYCNVLSCNACMSGVTVGQSCTCCLYP